MTARTEPLSPRELEAAIAWVKARMIAYIRGIPGASPVAEPSGLLLFKFIQEIRSLESLKDEHAHWFKA